MFELDKHLLPCHIIVDKIGAYQSGAPCGGSLLVQPTSMKISCVCFRGQTLKLITQKYKLNKKIKLRDQVFIIYEWAQ